jgi:hypothetical protein
LIGCKDTILFVSRVSGMHTAHPFFFFAAFACSLGTLTTEESLPFDAGGLVDLDGFGSAICSMKSNASGSTSFVSAWAGWGDVAEDFFVGVGFSGAGVFAVRDALVALEASALFVGTVLAGTVFCLGVTGDGAAVTSVERSA